MTRWYNSRPMHVTMFGTSVLVTIFAVLMVVALAFELVLEVWWFTFVDLIPDQFFDLFFEVGIAVTSITSLVAIWSVIDSLSDLRVVNKAYRQPTSIKITASHNLVSNTLILLLSVFLLLSLLLGVRFPPYGLHESLWVLRMLLAFILLILVFHLRAYRFHMREVWIQEAIEEIGRGYEAKETEAEGDDE